MAKKTFPQVTGVGNTDNLVHHWLRLDTKLYIAACDPDLHAQSVNKGKQSDLCPACAERGL